jgi:hypothetical protein
LSSRLSGGEIVVGKTFGSLFGLRWMLFPVLVGWVLAIALEPKALGRSLATAATLAVLGSFHSAVGVYFSLRSRNSIRALSVTLFVSLLVMGGYLFGVLPFLSPAAPSSSVATIVSPSTAVLLVRAANANGSPDHLIPVQNFLVCLAFYFLLTVYLLLRMTWAFDRWTQRTPRLSRDARH